jgi:hypothetical protein
MMTEPEKWPASSPLPELRVSKSVLRKRWGKGGTSGAAAAILGRLQVTWINDIIYRTMQHLRAKIMVVTLNRLAPYLGATWGEQL